MNKIIALNFKENMPKMEINKYIKELEKAPKDEEIVIAAPYVYLPVINKGKLSIAAQNVSMFESGSYTGEVSASMLKDFNIDYVIIGHNERRTIFCEENKEINLKIKNALKNNLKVILCVTSISELKKSLKGIDLYEKIIIAFEPKKYMGKSETISREELIKFIDKINKVTDFRSRILYGGGIKKDNIKKLSGINGLDGLLIGKASLDIEQVKDIINLW